MSWPLAMVGTIERRLLVNYRVDAEVLRVPCPRRSAADSSAASAWPASA